MSFHTHKFHIGCVITLTLMACRTAAPKKNAEMLDASTIKGAESAPDDPRSGGDPASMWSPSNRRANAMFHFLLAEKYALEGNAAESETHYESSYNLDPNSFTGSRLARAKILRSPESEDGLVEARRMALLYPLDSQLRLLYGQSLLIKRDYSEAEVQLKKAIELEPTNEDGYLAIIRCYQLMSKTSLAVESARKMTRMMPANARGWSVLSRLLLADKRAREALDPARRAWELQESNPELALIYALTLDLNKKGKEAVKLYEQLYRFNPGNQDLVQRMVSLYRELGNLETALNLLDDMIENSRDEVPGLKMQKVLVLWAMNRYQDAQVVLAELGKELPESDRVNFMRAVGFASIDRPQEAIELFGKVQNESPMKQEAMRYSAVALRSIGRMSEALDVARQMAGRTDADSSSYLFWAELLFDNKNLSEAIKVLGQGIEKFPDDYGLHFTKGMYLERSGDRSGSERVLRDLLARNPNDPRVNNYLGYMLAEDGRNLDEAEDLIRKALRARPDDGAYMDSLGWVMYQKKNYQQARKYLEKAVELAPEEGVIWEHLADVYMALGDKKAAIEKYQEGLKRKNDPKDQERIQKKYDKLAPRNP